MLLAIDIGNTNISLGIFKGKTLKHNWRLSTSASKTVDEYYISLSGLFEREKLNPESVKDIIILSVAPKALGTIKEALARIFTLRPHILGESIEAPIKNLYERAEEVGQDRLVNGISAYHIFKKQAIVVDFGTAITFDVISAMGEYRGGIIIPGIEISLAALVDKAALIPEIKLDKPKRLIGKNTVDSVRSGIVYGFASLCDGIIEKIRNELGNDISVIATGGQAEIIIPYSQKIDRADPHLTLNGLKIIYDKKVKK